MGSSPRKEQVFGGINLTINTGEFRGAQQLGGHVADLHSSPPTFEGSEIQNLRDYLDWLIEKGHTSFKLGHTA